MRIGLIHPRRVVDNDHSTHDWYCFVISPSDVSEREILDSQSAGPGRYVAELVQRISGYLPARQDALLIFNPLLLLHPSHLGAVITCLDDDAPLSDITVLEDRSGYPIAYHFAFPSTLDIRFLLLLSGSRGHLDQRLLTAAFGNADRITLDFRIVSLPNGFAAGAHLRPGEWVAEHACRVLEAGLSALPPGVRSAHAEVRSRAIFSAFMPHHAGDVLLFGLASRHAPLWFNECVVNAAFVDAFGATGSPLLPQAVHGPPPYRDENAADDPDYFGQICDQLRNDRLYVYLRTARYAAVTDFHLLDHFAFALGRTYSRREDLLGSQPTRRRNNAPATDRLRVLLHFSAGWSLKSYPPTYQHRVVEEFERLGVEVTVLGHATDGLRCARIESHTVQSFARLLDEQHLLIGMDSFPAHYAAHIAGMPTLVLFSNTHWVNHAPPESSTSKHLDAGLNCCPCLARDVCPRFGAADCRNFTLPQTVIATAIRLVSADEQILLSLRKKMGAWTMCDATHLARQTPHWPSMEQPRYLREGTTPILLPSRIAPHAKLRNRLRCRALEAVGVLLKLGSLGREYLRCWTTHGLWLANFLLAAYIEKSIRDSRPEELSTASPSSHGGESLK